MPVERFMMIASPSITWAATSDPLMTARLSGDAMNHLLRKPAMKTRRSGRSDVASRVGADPTGPDPSAQDPYRPDQVVEEAEPRWDGEKLPVAPRRAHRKSDPIARAETEEPDLAPQPLPGPDVERGTLAPQPGVARPAVSVIAGLKHPGLELAGQGPDRPVVLRHPQHRLGHRTVEEIVYQEQVEQQNTFATCRAR